jgi:hypothetical protein
MNFSLGMSMTGIVAVIVATMAPSASAQPPWLQNTPLDPSTYPGAIKDVGQAASQVFQGVLPRAPQPSVSGLDVLTPPHMDHDGFIYSGTTNTSQSRNRVGRGQLHMRRAPSGQLGRLPGRLKGRQGEINAHHLEQF